MNGGEWIVCERGPRWATALRALVERHEAVLMPTRRVKELRSLPDLEATLVAYPTSIALIEITRRNFGEILNWLANSTVLRRKIVVVALLDIETPQDDRQLAIDALREAGACDVIESPRQLRSIIGLGVCCMLRASTAAAYAEKQSVAEMAWTSLPWQDA